MTKTLSILGRAAMAAAVLSLAACLPAAVGENLSKTVRQNKALQTLAKDSKKVLRKSKQDPAATSTAYGAYMSAQAQLVELMIQAAGDEKAPNGGEAAVAAVNEKKAAFIAQARTAYEKAGKSKDFKAPATVDADPAKLWGAYLGLKPGQRESAVEKISDKLMMKPWDDL